MVNHVSVNFRSGDIEYANIWHMGTQCPLDTIKLSEKADVINC